MKYYKIKNLQYYRSLVSLSHEGVISYEGFPHSSAGKESACKAGDTGNIGDTSSIPGSGRSPGGGNGNPLQYPCLANPMD